jgi:hypothetical protein
MRAAVHGGSIRDAEVFVERVRGNSGAMLRKVTWTALYAALGAAATIAARAVASRIYRILTGEAPPVKK